MADYYPLIARAVAASDKNTAEIRRGIYERARSALLAQLRSVNPPLSEGDITRERLALEEAIRKVEAHAVKQARADVTRPAPGAAGSGSTPRPAAGAGGAAAALRSELAPARPSEARARLAQQPIPNFEIAPRGTPRVSTERAALDLSLKDLRGTAPRTDEREAAEARRAREAEQMLPERSRLEPRFTPREEPHEAAATSRLPPEPSAAAPVTHPPNEPEAEQDAEGGGFNLDQRPTKLLRPRRSRRGLIVTLVALLLVAGAAAFGYWQFANFLKRPINGGGTPPPTQQTGDAQTPGKIPDRLPNGQDPQKPNSVAAVAQRVVLYEEDPSNPQGKRFVGSAIWKTETVSPGAGQPPDQGVRAEIEIPERKMSMTMTIRRNTDKSMPASHTIEVMFKIPPDFPGGNIVNVPGVLMKESEQARGLPLAGVSVKVTNNYFLIALYSADAERQRNVEALKQRPWFDIPLVYANSQRGLIALEKGTPGDRAFADVFAAWGQ